MTDQTRWGIDQVQVKNKAIKYQKDLVKSAMAYVVKMDESGITDLMLQIEAEYERKYGEKQHLCALPVGLPSLRDNICDITGWWITNAPFPKEPCFFPNTYRTLATLRDMWASGTWDTRMTLPERVLITG